MKKNMITIITALISGLMSIAGGLIAGKIYEIVTDKVYDEEKGNFVQSTIAGYISGIAGSVAFTYTVVKVVKWIIGFVTRARS